MLSVMEKVFYIVSFVVNLDKINITMIKVSDTAKENHRFDEEDGFDAATDYVRVGVKVDAQFVL
jgi:hypothetical protein